MRLNGCVRWVLGLSLGVASFGCSDSSPRTSGNPSVGSLSCGSAPCGGDVLGSWQVEGACLDGTPDFSSDDCPDATGSISDFDLTGTFTFHDDGTGTNQIHIETAVRVNIPQSCTMGFSCEQIEEFLTSDDEDAPAVQCSGSGSCTCTSRFIEDASETFTWETSGTQLILDGDTSAPLDYCVDGNGLMVQSDRGPDGEDISFTAVLQRT